MGAPDRNAGRMGLGERRRLCSSGRLNAAVRPIVLTSIRGTEPNHQRHHQPVGNALEGQTKQG